MSDRERRRAGAPDPDARGIPLRPRAVWRVEEVHERRVQGGCSVRTQELGFVADEGPRERAETRGDRQPLAA